MLPKVNCYRFLSYESRIELQIWQEYVFISVSPNIKIDVASRNFCNLLCRPRKARTHMVLESYLSLDFFTCKAGRYVRHLLFSENQKESRKYDLESFRQPRSCCIGTKLNCLLMEFKVQPISGRFVVVWGNLKRREHSQILKRKCLAVQTMSTGFWGNQPPYLCHLTFFNLNWQITGE